MNDPVRQRYAMGIGKGIGAHPAESKPTVRYAKGGRVPTTTTTHKPAHTAKGFKKHPWKS